MSNTNYTATVSEEALAAYLGFRAVLHGERRLARRSGRSLPPLAMSQQLALLFHLQIKKEPDTKKGEREREKENPEIHFTVLNTC